MQTPSLIELGMRPFFQQQLSLDELENGYLGRVVEHHKTEVVLLGEQGTMRFALTPGLEQICVGDWVVFDDSRILRVLERASIIKRKAAGSKHAFQLIAANIDTVFIVTSLNDDFSLNRIERYLALIKNAHIEPVVVLTKADTCSDVEKYCLQVQSLDSLLSVIAINALKEEGCDLLTPYCRKGQTLAFMGSSGVGKSTIVNALLGSDELKTAGIREQDSKKQSYNNL
ncbi:GTPase RsgA [Pseudoalteromonas sp. GB43]